MKLWDNNKGSNCHIIVVSEGGEKENVAKNVFEIMTVNVPNFEKSTNLYMQQDKQTPNDMIKK